jgi:heptose I phosphotransferase
MAWLFPPDNTLTMSDSLLSCRRIDAGHARKRMSVGPRQHDEGRMWVDREYEAELKQLGLASFDAVMNSSIGQLLRTLSDRENWRLEATGEHGNHVYFLKKHRVRSFVEVVRSWIGPRRCATAGRIEAQNVEALKRAGIATMRVVAFGERVRGAHVQSFFMTEELRGFMPLDDFLRQRFVPAAERLRIDCDLKALAASVADVANRFHTAGFNHRDFYCCHFFIQELPGPQFAVRLIDLQRVEQRRWLRRRWIVKDLAQLAYSAPRERVGRALRMAFIKRYLGVARLRPADKTFIRCVLRRQAAMERRLGRHP